VSDDRRDRSFNTTEKPEQCWRDPGNSERSATRVSIQAQSNSLKLGEQRGVRPMPLT
jgi:hypothetical protein